MQALRVAVIGGGLAGIVAALRLAERGCRVTLYEAGHRLGGKAGARMQDGLGVDHGYHIFPPWYVNLWQLIDELGIKDRFRPVNRFHSVRIGAFPTFVTLQWPATPRNLWRNIRSGFGPPLEVLLYYFAILDLASQAYRLRSYLDRITLNGFVRSRFYRTEWLAARLGADILQATSLTSYLASAMTVRNVFRYWIRNQKPLTSILDRDLETGLIQPFAHRLMDLGVMVHTCHRLERIESGTGKLTSLLFRQSDGSVVRVDPDAAVLAVPPEVVASLVDDPLFRATPQIADVGYLHSAPMAMVTLVMKSRIPELPPEHVFLEDSKYQISLIDVAQIWSGLNTSVLSVVAADYTPLKRLTAAMAAAEIIKELGRFIPPVQSANIASMVFSSHLNEPLCLNTVGSWEWRPAARSGLANLYLAGDYCRADVDVISMESAVASGLAAADALREDHGLSQPIEVRSPTIVAPWKLVLLRFALLPGVVIVRLLLPLAQHWAAHDK